MSGPFWRIEASGSCLPANTGCCRSGFSEGAFDEIRLTASAELSAERFFLAMELIRTMSEQRLLRYLSSFSRGVPRFADVRKVEFVRIEALDPGR